MIKAVFLDRDDTICVNVPYCSKPEDLHLIDGVGDALLRLKKEGFYLFLVTNQSGISRGYFTHKDLARIHNKMGKDLIEFGVSLDDIFYCPCHPLENCIDRKPGIGMFMQAFKKYKIDKRKSFMIGDKRLDIEAGQKFGVKSILVTNESERNAEDYFASDMSNAVTWILKNEK
tara:strand:+ start:528 stop:1046 length:519 start_codon:yes stop_codon:yes gene_type:complete